jgi:hypothetical protein
LAGGEGEDVFAGDAAAGAGAGDGVDVDVVLFGQAADGGGRAASTIDGSFCRRGGCRDDCRFRRGRDGGAGSGFGCGGLRGRGCLGAVGGSDPGAFADETEDFANGDDVALAFVDAREDTVIVGGDVEVDFVGLQLDEGFATTDGVTFALQPLADDRIDQGLPEWWHPDFDRHSDYSSD